MGWFHPVSAADSAQPRRNVVSVLRARDGKTAGAGVLLAPDQLLTCAHVVNDALGRAVFEGRSPGIEQVRVSFYGPSSTRRYDARVAYWIPPRQLDGSLLAPDGADREWLGDLAVLQIDTPLAERLDPPQWREMAAGQQLRAWHSTGLRSSFADVLVKDCDGAIGYVDGAATGMPIGPAYSGGPLWSEVHNAVVGVVAAHIMPPSAGAGAEPFSSQHISRRSWAIPWQRIEDELRAVGAGVLLDVPEPDDDDPALPLLVDQLEMLMPTPSSGALYGRTVAESCGLGFTDDGSAPSPWEFARVLLSRPRALAALSEVVRRRDSAAAGALLAAGRLSPVPRLLSPREHRRLRSLLNGLPGPVAARLPEAVRAALPLVATGPADAGTEALLDRLEALPGDSRTESGEARVPGLLRVVEYLAVLCSPAQRAGLRLWGNEVADRLGTPRAALLERRSDADDWAALLAGRIAPPRVLVQVTGVTGGRFLLRVWCDEGAGPRQVSVEGARTYSDTEAAAALLRELESLHRGATRNGRPQIEALVDRAGLNLPIDEWESGDPDELIPGVLGAEYPLVVNCPELLRRSERFLHEWRRRWSQLDTGDWVPFTDSTVGPRQMYSTLMGRLDAVRVSVDLPAPLRDTAVQVCLAVGIPVVVWDRGARSSHAVELMGGVATRQLPEAVRSYRAQRLGLPEEFPGRPVLAWADADRTVPQLHLSEPQETT